MNTDWFRLAESYTMHLDFSYCKTCDWMLQIWKKAEELRGNAMSSGIKPLSENVAQQLADAIEESNKAQQELNECLPELTDNIFRMVEDEIAAELLINTRRLATASFLTRRYWKRKVEKSKAALEETHKEFDAWRKVYHK